VDRFVNLIYYWAARGMSEEDRDRFDRHLVSPVSGDPERSVRAATGSWSRNAELAQFKRAQ